MRRAASARDLRVDAACLAVLLGLAGPVHLLHAEADAWRGPPRADQELRRMPSGRSLEVASLGYRNALADLLWLQAVNMFGRYYLKDEGDREWLTWLYHLVDLVTDLDPRFRSAYLHGGTLLRLFPEWVTQSTLVFDKGARNLPGEWVFPFNISMNYYVSLKDTPTAAEYMRRASVIPDSPFYLRNLAASMLDEAQQLDTALVFVRQEMLQVSEPHVRMALEVKEQELRYRIAIRDVDRAHDLFREATGRGASHPRELVPKFLPEVPEDPLGGRIVFDRRKGRAVSSRYADWRRETRERTGLGSGGVEDEEGGDGGSHGGGASGGHP